jgi:hypothetical protein
MEKNIKLIKEENAVHHTMAFVRMNPPHAGHGELVDKVQEVQKKNGGTHSIVLSKTSDPKKNPLTPEQKLQHVRNAFPHAHVESDDGLLQHLSKLHKRGVTHLHMVAGADRLEGFKKLIQQYNGKKGPHGYYNFKHITFHSSGERDPDAEGIEGYSASKMREYAHNGDFKSFAAAAPRTMKPEHVKAMFNDVKAGLAAPKKERLKEEHCAANFKAIFLVGGPGSGKDFLIHSSLNEFAVKEVSMERVFNAIVKETNIEELEDFPSVIVNGNADNLDKVVVVKAIMETMGYDTSMIYVYTSDESSKNRNDFRISRGAKTFSENIRKIKYDISVSNLEKYVEMFESFVLYDNSNNFVTVNEEKKKEITGWLSELHDTVTNFLAKEPSNESAVEWIVERVLEVGLPTTAAFAGVLTPGQYSNKVHTYANADKIIPGPKYSQKAAHPEKEGNKYTGGGVAFASRNSTQRTIPENVKHHKAVKDPIRKIGPVLNIATTGTGGTTYQDTGGGVEIGPNSESVSVKQIKSRIKNKIKPAASPGEMLKQNAAGGGGDYVPSVGGIQELKKPKYGTKMASDYGMVQNFGSSSASGLGTTGYKEETKKKKKFKRIMDNPDKPSTGLGIGAQMGSELMTATFEEVKKRVETSAFNFDEVL